MRWKKSGPVRDAKKSDLDRVTELRRQLHEMYTTGRADFFQKPFGDELTQQTRGMLRDKQSVLLVYEEDGTVCGYLYAVFVSESANLYHDARSYCSVREICVDRTSRGQGIGSAMLQKLREIVVARGCPKIELQNWECNAGALEFWEKQGFGTYVRVMEWKAE